jgi:hypothetical protein
MRDSDDIKDAALRAARAAIKRERGVMLESGCLLDKRLRPRRATLDDAIKPHVERLERLLRKIDRAIMA